MVVKQGVYILSIRLHIFVLAWCNFAKQIIKRQKLQGTTQITIKKIQKCDSQKKEDKKWEQKEHIKELKIKEIENEDSI